MGLQNQTQTLEHSYKTDRKGFIEYTWVHDQYRSLDDEPKAEAIVIDCNC